MKQFIINVLIFLLSAFIVMIGFNLFAYWLDSGFTLVGFIVGFIGYHIALKPAIDLWEGYFKDLFKINQK